MKRGDICRDCGRKIVWVETSAGKMMPCDPGVHAYWANKDGRGRIVTLNGEVLACTFWGAGSATGLGYTPHWATCKREEKPEAEYEQMKIGEEWR